MCVLSLASLSGLRIQCCRELWCKLQAQLGSCVAMVMASIYSSNSAPSLGTSICHMCHPKKTNRLEKKKKVGELEVKKKCHACFHLCIERSQMKTLVHHPEIYILVLEKRICFFKDVLIFWAEYTTIKTLYS